MAATHPPSSALEEHHQQSAFEKSSDSLINSLTDSVDAEIEKEQKGFKPVSKVRKRNVVRDVDGNEYIMSLW